MCYSAQVQADYKKYVTMFGASMGIREFYEVFYRRGLDAKIKIPKAVEASFANPQTDDERAIKALIDEYNAKQAAKFEEELFKQRKRLAGAERTLQGRPTKKAQEDQRIASDKIRQLMGRHADLKRNEPLDRDSRIFPGSYVPVMIWEDGQRVIKPMRYGCRPAGKPAFYDVKYPGTYNARRDNLQGLLEGPVRAHPRAHRRQRVLREREPAQGRRPRACGGGGGREPGARVQAPADAGHARRVPLVEVDRLRRTGPVVLRGNHRRTAAGGCGCRTRSMHRPHQGRAHRPVVEPGIG